MNVSLILLLLLIGALVTYLAGDKLASKVALFFGLGTFGASIVLLNQYNAGENISLIANWINQPKVVFCTKSRWIIISNAIINYSINSYNYLFFFWK